MLKKNEKILLIGLILLVIFPLVRSYYLYLNYTDSTLKYSKDYRFYNNYHDPKLNKINPVLTHKVLSNTQYGQMEKLPNGTMDDTENKSRFYWGANRYLHRYNESEP